MGETMTTQLATNLPPTKPLQSRPEVLWLGFTPDIEFDTAARIFEKRYGHKPRVLVRDGGSVKAGPIEDGA